MRLVAVFDRNRLGLLCGSVAALCWAACHLLFHEARPWLSWELGEWDVALVTEAILAGERVELQVGAIHGHELGSYLAALALLPLRWLGVPSLVASKTVALAVGAIATGIAVGVATGIARRRTGSSRAGVVAALVVASVVCVSWPSWHRDLAGLNGRTPESALPALCAALLLFRWPLPGLKHLALAGVCLGIAWMFSPASIWMLGLALLVSLAPGSASVPERLAAVRALPKPLIRVGVMVVFVALPLVLVAVLTPGGWDGLTAFLGKQMSQAGDALAGQAKTHPNASEQRGVLQALLAGPAVLGSVGADFGITYVRHALSIVGWAVLSVCGVGLLVSLRRRELSTEVLLVLAALTFTLPLSLIAVGPADVATAARYFVIPLYLTIVAAACWLAMLVEKHPRIGGAGVALLVVVALVPLPSIGQIDSTPSWTLHQSILSTGAHGLPVLEGEARHKAFRVLLRGAPEEGRLAFIEGYGTDLGGEASLVVWEREPVDSTWERLLEELEPAERHSLLVGVGCGFTRMAVDEELLTFALSRPANHHPDLFYGLAFCLFDTTRTHPSEFAADEEVVGQFPEEARKHWEEGRRDAAVEPPRAPRRSTIGNPAERMRALPSRGTRPPKRNDTPATEKPKTPGQKDVHPSEEGEG